LRHIDEKPTARGLVEELMESGQRAGSEQTDLSGNGPDLSISLFVPKFVPKRILTKKRVTDKP
jgi:hypothetical protein